MSADLRRLQASTGDRTKCVRCGEPSTRQVGCEWLCHLHAEAILEPIRRKVIEPAERIGGGIGRRAGPLDGGGWCLLACSNVPMHSWTGPPGEWCAYCARFEQLNLEHTAELVLRPPDIPVGDVHRAARIDAWLERLARAVLAGTITKTEAERAAHRVDR